MNKTTITVGSVTYAIKARKLLQRMKIQSKLIKIDASISPDGCKHGIEFDSDDLFSVVMGLRNAGINYKIIS